MSQTPLYDALVAIRDGKLPCKECGEPHEYRATTCDNPRHASAGTWAADDGHAYQRITPDEYARQVLG